MSKMTIEEAMDYVAESPEEANSDVMEIMGWAWKRTPKGDRWSKDGEMTVWRTPNILGRYDLFLKYCVEWMKKHNIAVDYYDTYNKYYNYELKIHTPMKERVALFLVTFG